MSYDQSFDGESSHRETPKGPEWFATSIRLKQGRQQHRRNLEMLIRAQLYLRSVRDIIYVTRNFAQKAMVQ